MGFSVATRLAGVGARPGQGDRTAGPSLVRHALVGLAASTAVVAGAVVGGKAFVSPLPGAWFFGLSGATGAAAGATGSAVAAGSTAGSTAGSHPSALAVFCVYGGLLVLAATWWRLVRALDSHRGMAVARVLVVVAVWSLPFLIAPPMFSRDVFSYAGQGQMVSHHIDAYRYGTGVLGVDRFTSLAGPLWATTPSPYGPLFLFLDGLAATVAGHQVLADLVLLRLLAVAGVALVAIGIPTLARAAGRDPAAAVVLGAGSPLVLSTLVAGDHNDALMVGLLVVGLAAARRFGPVPGIVLCALAGAVKAPALLGVAFVGWNWVGTGAPFWQRVRRTAAATAIAAATLAVVSWATGIGWGWVRTVAAEDKIHTGVTPVDALARLVAVVGDGLGLGWSMSGVRAVFATGGLIVAAGVVAWLLWRSPRLGTVRSLGLALLALALLAPVLWAWYLTWGLVVLAPVAAGRLRRALAGLTVAEAVIGASSVIGILHAVVDLPLAQELLLVAGMGAVAVGCLHWLTATPYGPAGPAAADRRTPWSGRRPVQPAGAPATAIQRPQSAQ